MAGRINLAKELSGIRENKIAKEIEEYLKPLLIANEIEEYLKRLLEKHYYHMPIDELYKAFKLFEEKYDIDIRYIETLDVEEDREDKRIEYRTESFKIYDYNDKQFIAEIVVYTVTFYSDLAKQEIKDEIVEDVNVLLMD